MKIKTERLDNHTARLTVEVDEKRWEKAKKDAARELSNYHKIPGFRKGKAPYKIMLRYVGEAAILDETIDHLANEIYSEALEQSDVEPYAPGTIEDFKLEPPTYIFSVELRPEAQLGDYRSVRRELTTPEVTDEEVDEVIAEYQRDFAVVEDNNNPIQVGDRVTIEISSEFTDGAERPPEPQETQDDDSDDDKNNEEQTPLTVYKGDKFIENDEIDILLDPSNEPFIPGFTEALLGANVDETVEFELTIPEEDRFIEEAVGLTVKFVVTILGIENVTLHEVNDDFAALVTQDDEEGPLSLLEMRSKIRQNLQEQAHERAKTQYFDDVMTEIVEGATFKYSQGFLKEFLKERLEEFGEQLQADGLNIETYKKVMGITDEELQEKFHDIATERAKRSLAFSEVIVQEKITVTKEDVDQEIEQLLSSFGERAHIFHDFFATPEQRERVASNILFNKLTERVIKMAQGETLADPDTTDDNDDVPQPAPPESETTDDA